MGRGLEVVELKEVSFSYFFRFVDGTQQDGQSLW